MISNDFHSYDLPFPISLISFSQAANEFHWNPPKISSHNKVKIVGGRHPLQELCVEQFVPNDTSLNCGKTWINPTCYYYYNYIH